MLKSYWRFVVAVGLALAVFAGLSWWLLPSPPSFGPYEQHHGSSSEYQPGGANCRQQALAQLRGAQRLSEADRCAEAKEQHRLTSEDLMQQQRAADAAQVAASLQYRAVLIEFLGAALGFFTLATAIAAVWYAKRAADASEESVNLALSTSQAQLRSYLGSDKERIEFEDQETKLKGFFELIIINRGATPAHSTVFQMRSYVRHKNGGIDRAGRQHNPMGTLAPEVPVEARVPFVLNADLMNEIDKEKAFLVAEVEARYCDAFGQFWVYKQTVIADSKTFQGGPVYTAGCEQYEEPPENTEEEDSPELPYDGR